MKYLSIMLFAPNVICISQFSRVESRPPKSTIAIYLANLRLYTALIYVPRLFPAKYLKYLKISEISENQ